MKIVPCDWFERINYYINSREQELSSIWLFLSQKEHNFLFFEKSNNFNFNQLYIKKYTNTFYVK
jgi:hypothetical protein